MGELGEFASFPPPPAPRGGWGELGELGEFASFPPGRGAAGGQPASRGPNELAGLMFDMQLDQAAGPHSWAYAPERDHVAVRHAQSLHEERRAAS